MRGKLFLLIALVYSYTAFLTAQALPDSLHIENLVFEGAGIRGIAYAGAVKVLEEKNILKNIKNVGGTSAGAVTSLMIALGYNSGEIYKIISKTKYRKFNEGGFLFLGGMWRLNKHFGWYRNKRYVRWLEKLVYDKAGTKDVRFKDLEKYGFKNLVVTGTCLTHQRIVVFSKDGFPDMRIVDAVAISMSIPLYFRAIFMDNQGNIYRNIYDKDSLHVMVDGGVLANYPIYLFDGLKNFNMPKNHSPNPHTLGFRIDTKAQIKQDSICYKSLATRKIYKLSDYIEALYNVTGETLNRYPLTDADWVRTVSISSAGIGPKIKRMSFEQRQTLYRSGLVATRQFFARRKEIRKK